MTGLAFLIPVALGLGLLGLGFFFWTMKDGQYDDLDGAAHRILIEDEDEDGVRGTASDTAASSRKPTR
ncbi:cbb3-type cytochrome oxidase assembly protein CcoS [Pseudopontixanthobacter vadosimaris]|uniref:cbb3-type cytochrome oxidase assembly protein CcoS n=1 Tax=Pseudopontixanthobacter vadosimaris TaxID=2726450 RepID=UPI0014742CB1|nr:cbb3-type cytochrome oxidase assembly protein CcoS [Pseudopontixanthobacter vadosimaris]